MIININIDIELNNEQVSLLRKFYIDKSTIQFWGRSNAMDKSIAESLVESVLFNSSGVVLNNR